jgi:hypothetical protein
MVFNQQNPLDFVYSKDSMRGEVGAPEVPMARVNPGH